MKSNLKQSPPSINYLNRCLVLVCLLGFVASIFSTQLSQFLELNTASSIELVDSDDTEDGEDKDENEKRDKEVFFESNTFQTRVQTLFTVFQRFLKIYYSPKFNINTPPPEFC